MATGNTDFYIEQGATFVITLTWKDEEGSLVDLTGCTARMQVRKIVASETVLLELTTGNGRISIDVVKGEITLTVSATDTASLTWKTAVYDLEIVHPDSTITRLLQGNVIISREVTR